jgi:hypothetical protein
MGNLRTERSLRMGWLALARGLCAALVAAAAPGQNLVVNGSFDTDLTGWTPDGGNTVIAWSALDADGAASSGSARLANPAVDTLPSNLGQCIEVAPAASVSLSARYLLEGGGFGYAMMNALQFLTTDCSGTPFFLPGARQDGQTVGAWGELSSQPTLDSGFRSIRFTLAVVGNGRSAHFDDVAVEESGGGPLGECHPSATTLCLVGDRYEVRATWRTAGDSGDGRAVELNDGPASGTGYFWFFDATNVEVVVKVLDACVPPFDRVWIFAGGLTDQEVELRVTDTQTGAFWTHLNSLGEVWGTVADTQALDVCD